MIKECVTKLVVAVARSMMLQGSFPCVFTQVRVDIQTQV